MSSMLSHLLDDMSVDTSYTVERFIKEAAQGRLEAVKKMLPKMKDRVMFQEIYIKTLSTQTLIFMISKITLRYHPE